MFTVDTARQRSKMVQLQLAARDIHDQRVLDAMALVPRQAFVDDSYLELAYSDAPLPIGCGQTISQPYVVALMIQALELRPTDRVLEIGAGSGYAAAVMSRIAAEVYAIERIEELAELAIENCRGVGYDNIQIRLGDGTLGWPELAPFDAIVVAAGGPWVPQALLDQLEIGGRLVMPVGRDRISQTLVVVRKTGATECEQTDLGGVRFVPLVGKQGWP